MSLHKKETQMCLSAVICSHCTEERNREDEFILAFLKRELSEGGIC
jgi:hypothetical protein